MRRVLARAAVTAAVFAAAACTGDPAQPPPTTAPAPSGMASIAASAPPSPGDPIVTKKVCIAATAAAAEGNQVYNDQIAALEQAASQGDPTAMVEAAEVIQKKLVELANSLDTWSEESVSPPLKAALTNAAKVLANISSESYSGTPADIQRQLIDLAATFTKACA